MKEQVIVFEGEHLFVAPKKRISNKKKGVQVSIPEELNVVAPVGVGVLPPPIEPPRQPDEPIGSPKTTTTQEEDASKPTPVPADVTLASRGTLAQNDAIALGGAGGGVTTPTSDVTPIALGDKPKVLSDEEMPQPKVEPTPTPTTTTTAFGAVPLVPLSFGAAPMMGGGGGGGGEEEAPAEKKKTNYLWLVLLGIAGLIYFTKKKS
jgi:hypothetical protein